MRGMRRPDGRLRSVTESCELPATRVKMHKSGKIEAGPICFCAALVAQEAQKIVIDAPGGCQAAGPPRYGRTSRCLRRGSDRSRRGKLVLPAKEARPGHPAGAEGRDTTERKGPAEGKRCGCERRSHVAAVGAQTNRMYPACCHLGVDAGT